MSPDQVSTAPSIGSAPNMAGGGMMGGGAPTMAAQQQIASGGLPSFPRTQVSPAYGTEAGKMFKQTPKSEIEQALWKQRSEIPIAVEKQSALDKEKDLVILPCCKTIRS